MTILALGVLLLVICTSFWVRGIRRVRLPKNRVIFIAGWALAATLSVAGALSEPGYVSVPLALVTTLLSLFMLFTVAISRQSVGAKAIQVGETIPSFVAFDDGGHEVNSEDLLGNTILLKFFRGHW